MCSDWNLGKTDFQRAPGAGNQATLIRIQHGYHHTEVIDW